MLERLERHFVEEDVRQSEQLRPRVIRALESLKEEGVHEVTHNQIVSRIQQIHRPRHILDRIRNSVLFLSLEILEEDGEIAIRKVKEKIGNRVRETTLYKRVNPEQQTSAE